MKSSTFLIVIPGCMPTFRTTAFHILFINNFCRFKNKYLVYSQELHKWWLYRCFNIISTPITINLQTFLIYFLLYFPPFRFFLHSLYLPSSIIFSGNDVSTFWLLESRPDVKFCCCCCYSFSKFTPQSLMSWFQMGSSKLLQTFCPGCFFNLVQLSALKGGSPLDLRDRF